MEVSLFQISFPVLAVSLVSLTAGLASEPPSQGDGKAILFPNAVPHCRRVNPPERMNVGRRKEKKKKLIIGSLQLNVIDAEINAEIRSIELKGEYRGDFQLETRHRALRVPRGN